MTLRTTFENLSSTSIEKFQVEKAEPNPQMHTLFSSWFGRNSMLSFLNWQELWQHHVSSWKNFRGYLEKGVLSHLTEN